MPRVLYVTSGGVAGGLHERCECVHAQADAGAGIRVLVKKKFQLQKLLSLNIRKQRPHKYYWSLVASTRSEKGFDSPACGSCAVNEDGRALITDSGVRLRDVTQKKKAGPTRLAASISPLEPIET